MKSGSDYLPVSLEHICLNGLENTENLDFSKLKNLETLYINDSSLICVNIDNPDLEGISLANNNSLVNLYISEGSDKLKKIFITDCPKLLIDVDDLKKLSSLEYLSVNKGVFTDTDIEKLVNSGIEVNQE